MKNHILLLSGIAAVLCGCASVNPEKSPCSKGLAPIFALPDVGYCATGDITITTDKQQLTAKTYAGSVVTTVCVLPGFVAAASNDTEMAKVFYAGMGINAQTFKQSKCSSQ